MFKSFKEKIILIILSLAIMILGLVTIFNIIAAKAWENKTEVAISRVKQALDYSKDGSPEKALKAKLNALTQQTIKLQGLNTTEEALNKRILLVVQQARESLEEFATCVQGVKEPLLRAGTSSTIEVPADPPYTPVPGSTTTTLPRTVTHEGDASASKALTFCEAALGRSNLVLLNIKELLP